MPRKIVFPPLPGTEDERWDKLTKEFGMEKGEIAKALFNHRCPSWMFDKGFINEWDVRKILLKNGYRQVIQPEEEDPEKTYNEWLEKHPFTKKWYETCPYFNENPHYEKPNKAEIINGAEKIDIEKETPKETKIERPRDPRDIYIAENNRNLHREIAERKLNKLKKIIDKDTDMIDCNKNADKAPTEKDELKEEIKISRNVMEAYKVEDQRRKMKKIENREKLSDEDERKILAKWERGTATPQEYINKLNELDKAYQPKENVDLNEYNPAAETDLIRTIQDKLPVKTDEYGHKFINWDKITNPVPDESVEENNENRDYQADAPDYSFNGILSMMRDIHEAKNSDYEGAADEGYKRYGMVYYLSILFNKLKRLESLTIKGNKQQVLNESVDDTLIDMAVYAVMALESMRKKR